MTSSLRWLLRVTEAYRSRRSRWIFRKDASSRCFWAGRSRAILISLALTKARWIFLSGICIERDQSVAMLAIRLKSVADILSPLTKYLQALHAFDLNLLSIMKRTQEKITVSMFKDFSRSRRFARHFYSARSHDRTKTCGSCQSSSRSYEASLPWLPRQN
jgi:hypothetical protein